MFGSPHCFRRAASAPDSNFLCRLLQLRQNASVVAQGCAEFSSDSTDRNHSFTPDPRWASPSLRPGLGFRLCVPKTLSELMTWWNRLSWRNDRAVLFRSGRPGLAIQVEVAA